MFLKQINKDIKLPSKYCGPYIVLQNISSMDYKLDPPSSSRVHPIFRVSNLNKVIGDNIPIETIFLELDEQGNSILGHEQITETITKHYEIGLLLSTSSIKII